MDNRMVSCFFLLTLLIAAGCSFSPSASPVTKDTADRLTPSAMKTPALSLPASILPSPPPGRDWPIKSADDLKQVLKDAPIIFITIEGFLYCPPFYDSQGRIASQACTMPNVEVSEQAREQFIAAVEEGSTQSGQLPEELRCMREIPCLDPGVSVFLLLPEFSIRLDWYTERSFIVSQTYYPGLLQRNVWHPTSDDIEIERSMSAYVEFVQETPALYEAVQETAPRIVFPPEHFGHTMAYERVIAEYDGRRCAYYRGRSLAFGAFIHGMLARSVPVDAVHPSHNPRAVFIFWVRGKEYPVKMWQDGTFSYREKMYRYLPRNIGEPEPSFQAVLEDFLRNLSVAAECTPP